MPTHSSTSHTRPRSSPSPAHKPRRRKTKTISSSPSDSEGMPQRSPKALSTSLESIQIHPRTPKTPRSGDNRYHPDDAIDEVELSLLNDEDRQDDRHLQDEMDHFAPAHKTISSKDKRSMVLLVILCLSPFTFCTRRFLILFHPDLIQGFPVRFITPLVSCFTTLTRQSPPAGSRIGCVSVFKLTYAFSSLYPFVLFRICSIPSQRTFILFAACHLLPRQLSVLLEAPVVPSCRFLFLQVHRS